MRITIDTTAQSLTTTDDDGGGTAFPLYSREAFEIVSGQWLKVGWNLKYPYRFSWLGRPIIQLPSDMVRLQEVIFAIQPDVIIETGVAHGGSLVYSASLCRLIGKGRVIGIDLEIRPHNRTAIEKHFLSNMITLIEGDSIAPETVAKVKSLVKPVETTLVILDSNHTRAHVGGELAAYADLVSQGSYIVATDGIMRDLADVPGGRANWGTDNPAAAAEDFAKADSRFELAAPLPVFNESPLREDITHWPSAWLRRR